MTDTIFALSSGSGISGVAVIRLSGPGSSATLAALAGAIPPPRIATLRTLRAGGKTIDRGLILWFPGPASFTGEDSAEFHVHGGPSVVEAMLRALAELPGLRPAAAGEFSLRALKNGKLDLVEAEGLADLIHARSERQRDQAARQMIGRSSAVFEEWRAALIDLLARVEAAIDFADEAGVPEAALAEIRPRTDMLRTRMIEAMGSAAAAARVRDGLRIVLAGAPNVGKSSLLNRLAARDAAIVSALPGTTRDAIEADLLLGGVPAVVVDTAGLRPGSADQIEIEGMRRSRRNLADADIVLWISAPDIPGSAPQERFDSETIWIENKADISIQNRNDSGSAAHYRVSALTGQGVAELRQQLEARAVALMAGAENAIIVRERQRLAVSRAIDCLGRASGLSRSDVEVVAETLRAAAAELGRLTGHIGIEDVLDAVFRDFCIGK